MFKMQTAFKKLGCNVKLFAGEGIRPVWHRLAVHSCIRLTFMGNLVCARGCGESLPGDSQSYPVPEVW